MAIQKTTHRKKPLVERKLPINDAEFEETEVEKTVQNIIVSMSELSPEDKLLVLERLIGHTENIINDDLNEARSLLSRREAAAKDYYAITRRG